MIKLSLHEYKGTWDKKKGIPYPNPYQRNLCFFQGQKSIFEVNGQKKMLLGPKGEAQYAKISKKCNFLRKSCID